MMQLRAVEVRAQEEKASSMDKLEETYEKVAMTHWEMTRLFEKIRTLEGMLLIQKQQAEAHGLLRKKNSSSPRSSPVCARERRWSSLSLASRA